MSVESYILTVLLISIDPIYPTLRLILSVYIGKHSSFRISDAKGIGNINFSSKPNPRDPQGCISFIYTYSGLIHSVQVVLHKVEVPQDKISTCGAMTS